MVEPDVPDNRGLTRGILITAVAALALLGGCSSRGPEKASAASTAPTTREVTTTTAVPLATTTSATSTTTTTSTTRAPCPDDLAGQLATSDGATQLVTVTAPVYGTTYATVELWQRSGNCWVVAGGPWAGRIGESGFSNDHREGDGTTPTGIYGFEPVVYGNAPDPGTRYPYHQLVCGDWWDEDPTSSEYNTFQHVTCGETPPFGGSSEPLWQETSPYPSLIPVAYNVDPVVPGAGSAIFVHADNGQPTTGCVSIPRADLDQFLAWLVPADDPHIVMGPQSEITRF